jgi:predicted N-acetyltransferase YhbS
MRDIAYGNWQLHRRPIMTPMRLPDDVSIREMTADDIAAGLTLCRASQWNQTEQDWRFFLTAAPHGALVAQEDAGRVIGTVATLPYGPFTWISMVLVDPASRGRHVGTALLQRGLELADATARLDATPSGEAIYRKLGFASEYRLARWYLDARPRGLAHRSSVRPLAPADWPAILEMDQRAFGASRMGLLQRLADDAPEYARVVSRGGVQGYLFGRHGHNREHLGPLVADGPDTAAALLESTLADQPARRIYLDVPDDRQEWRDILSRMGFAIERPFLRMHRGPLTTPGTPSSTYAIAGPEFG